MHSLKKERGKVTTAQTMCNMNAMHDWFDMAICQELSDDKINPFLLHVDNIYKEAITKHFCDWQSPSEPLISAEKLLEVHHQFYTSFPIVYHVQRCSTVNERNWDSDDCDLHKKELFALFSFLATCRHRNNTHLTHWALVEGLALGGCKRTVFSCI